MWPYLLTPLPHSFPSSACKTITFAPATAPCAVMLPTGEQLSTSNTLNSLSSSDDGGNRWAVLFCDLFPLLLVSQDAGRAHRAHHGLLSVSPIELLCISSAPSLLLRVDMAYPPKRCPRNATVRVCPCSVCRVSCERVNQLGQSAAHPVLK